MGKEQQYVPVPRSIWHPVLLHRKHVLGAAGNSDTYGKCIYCCYQRRNRFSGRNGGAREAGKSNTLQCWHAWRHFAACSISEPVLAEITLLASSVVSLPAVLLSVMQNPSQPSGTEECYLATCSIDLSSQSIVIGDQYPKIDCRSKYCYSQCTPFNNTSSSSLQMYYLGGCCLGHFLKTGKTYFLMFFSPACSVYPEQISRKAAS